MKGEKVKKRYLMSVKQTFFYEVTVEAESAMEAEVLAAATPTPEDARYKKGAQVIGSITRIEEET